MQGLSQTEGCFRLQRYKLLKAIHNTSVYGQKWTEVVSDYKDTNFWKQFTTLVESLLSDLCCFRLQRYKLLKAIHNTFELWFWRKIVVSDYKDTNFWKQFTTCHSTWLEVSALFQTTKIQTFESNSQHNDRSPRQIRSCFRLQRYKLLKAIHNHLLLLPASR